MVGVLSAVWLACDTNTENLLDIEANPQKYVERIEPLHVQGKVVEFFKLPNQQKIFKIGDDSGGFLWVSSPASEKMRVNETYEGDGKVQIGLSMTSKAYGILFIEQPLVSMPTGSEKEQNAEGESQ